MAGGVVGSIMLVLDATATVSFIVFVVTFYILYHHPGDLISLLLSFYFQ